MREQRRRCAVPTLHTGAARLSRARGLAQVTWGWALLSQAVAVGDHST